MGAGGQILCHQENTAGETGEELIDCFPSSLVTCTLTQVLTLTLVRMVEAQGAVWPLCFLFCIGIEENKSGD